MSESNGNRFSLRPSQHSEGVYEGGAVIVKEARAAIFDWKGKGKPSTCIVLTFVPKGGDKARTEYITAGTPEFIRPTADGLSFEPVLKDGKPASKGISKKSNASRFLQSLVTAGFPENRLDAGLSALDNQEMTLDQEKTKKQDGGEGTRWIVTAVASVAPSNGNAAVSDTQSKAADAVRAVVIAAGGSLPSNQVAGKVFAALASDPSRNAVLPLLTPDFYGKLPGVTFDAGSGLLIAS